MLSLTAAILALKRPDSLRLSRFSDVLPLVPARVVIGSRGEMQYNPTRVTIRQVLAALATWTAFLPRHALSNLLSAKRECRHATPLAQSTGSDPCSLLAAGNMGARSGTPGVLRPAASWSRLGPRCRLQFGAWWSRHRSGKAHPTVRITPIRPPTGKFHSSPLATVSHPAKLPALSRDVPLERQSGPVRL